MALSTEQLKKYKEYLESKKQSPKSEKFADGGTVLEQSSDELDKELGNSSPYGHGSVGSQVNNALQSNLDDSKDEEFDKVIASSESPEARRFTEEHEKEELAKKPMVKEEPKSEMSEEDKDYVPDTTNTESAKEDIEANKMAKEDETPVEESSVASTESGVAPKELSVEQKSQIPEKEVPQDASNPVKSVLSAIMPNQGRSNIQELQRQNINNKLLKGLDLIGHGLAHAPGTPDLKMYDDNVKENQQMYMLKQEAQKEDPGSEYSKSFRQFTSQLIGKPIADNVSAAQLEKVMPYATLQVKNDMAKERALATIGAKGEVQEKVEDKKETNREKLAGVKGEETRKTQGEKIKLLEPVQEKKTSNASIAKLNSSENQLLSSRGPLGKPIGKIQLVEGLESALHQYKDLNDMPPEMFSEYTSMFNNLATGGQGTDVKYKALVNKGLPSKAASAWEYLTQDPTGANQKEFIKLFRTAGEEQANAAKQQVKQGLIQNYKNFETMVPESEIQKRLKDRGIDQDEYKNFQSTLLKPYNTGTPNQVSSPMNLNEEARIDPKSGKTAIFDSKTKQFIRWQKAQ